MVHFSGLWALSDETLRALLAPRCAGGVGDERATGKRVLDPCREVTIRLAQSEVWPWLAQVFRGGGTLGWPVLETPSRRSADYLLESVPEPRVGDSWGKWLELVEVVPRSRLTWRLRDDCNILGYPESGLLIEYSLAPLSDTLSRLSTRVSTPARHLTEPVSRHLRCAVDFVLPTFQLPRIRAAAETYPERLAQGDTNRTRVREHQVPGFVPGAIGVPGQGLNLA